MAQFEIQDPQTGRTVVVEGDQAPSQDTAEQIFHQAGLRSQGPQGFGSTVRGVSDVMRSVGLGVFPNVLGESTALFTGRQVQPDNPFISPEQFQQQKQMGLPSRFVQDAAGLASWIVPETNVLKGAGLAAKAGNIALRGVLRGELFGTSQGQAANPLYPAAGGLLEPLIAAIRSGKLTQRGINKAMESAKSESVDQGIKKSWSDIVTETKQKLAQGLYKFRPDLRQEVEKILRTKTPADTMLQFTPSEASKTLGRYVLKGAEATAHDLHDFRQALDRSIPKNAWNNPNVRPLGVEANQFVRQVVSDALHEIAPKTKFLDALNHLYYNPWVKNVAGNLPLIGGRMQYPNWATGVPSGLMNALIGVLGGEKAVQLFRK